MPDTLHVGAIEFALERLEKELDSRLVYHGVAHTRDSVLPAADRLGRLAGLSAENHLILTTAAAYHDIGFIIQRDGHEAAGCIIARETLPRFGYTPPQIEHVCQTIMATCLPQTPVDLVGELMADADLDVLGRDDLWETMQLLYCEWRNFGQWTTDEAFKAGQLAFISGHSYFSDAAKQLRNKSKQCNLATIVERFADPQTVLGLPNGQYRLSLE